MLNLRKLDTKKITAEEVRSDYLLFEALLVNTAFKWQKTMSFI